MLPNENALMSAGDVARFFGVDPKTVTRWAKSGALPPATRTPGGHRRWWRSQIEEAFRQGGERK